MKNYTYTSYLLNSECNATGPQGNCAGIKNCSCHRFLWFTKSLGILPSAVTVTSNGSLGHLVLLSNLPRIPGNANRLSTEFLGRCQLHMEIRPKCDQVTEPDASPKKIRQRCTCMPGAPRCGHIFLLQDEETYFILGAAKTVPVIHN